MDQRVLLFYTPVALLAPYGATRKHPISMVASHKRRQKTADFAKMAALFEASIFIWSHPGSCEHGISQST